MTPEMTNLDRDECKRLLALRDKASVRTNEDLSDGETT